MYVCLCHAVTDRKIAEAVKEGYCSLRQVQLCLRVGTNCGKCIPATRDVIRNTQAATPTRDSGKPPRLTLVASR